MLTEPEILQRIEWLKSAQKDNYTKLAEHVKDKEMWRIGDDMDKIAETRGKIFALRLVLGHFNNQE